MSTENKKKVLLGFGAFAVVLIAVLAIWRPPAFRSEDASGSIGAVQKHHAPQITQQDVILGSETTRHEQQVRYGDFLNDAAKLRALSAKVTGNNFEAASRDATSLNAEVASRYRAEANAAVAAAQILARESSNRDAAIAVQELSAILQSGHLSAADMESFNRRLAAFASQAGIQSAADRANAAKRQVDDALAEMRSNRANATAKIDNAVGDLKAMNAITLADDVDYLKTMEMESKALARDSEVLGKMASRPLAENQAMARAFDGTASDLEMRAAKNMDRELKLIIVVCSAVRDANAKLAEARGAQASAAGSQVYEKAYQAFAGTKTEIYAQANTGVNAQLNALNAYFAAARAGTRVAALDAVLANLSQQIAGNTALGASLEHREDMAVRTQNMANQQKARN